MVLPCGGDDRRRRPWPTSSGADRHPGRLGPLARAAAAQPDRPVSAPVPAAHADRRGQSELLAKKMVPEAGLEPARLAAQVFETCASADSATPALHWHPRAQLHDKQVCKQAPRQPRRCQTAGRRSPARQRRHVAAVPRRARAAMPRPPRPSHGAPARQRCGRSSRRRSISSWSLRGRFVVIRSQPSAAAPSSALSASTV